MCVMEPVTYDLDIKLTCIMWYIVDSYVLIYADALFETFELSNIWYAFKTKYILGLRYLIDKLYYLFCYMNKWGERDTG